jgi:hypothetical protein
MPAGRGLRLNFYNSAPTLQNIFFEFTQYINVLNKSKATKLGLILFLKKWVLGDLLAFNLITT